ncbi:MAG: helix-hairpin-helix domain-containing protein, partial [Bacteroidia bacterium]|nr:helix-hairpin-helix domain-containing protein [Bacteroidia bacterium]
MLLLFQAGYYFLDYYLLPIGPQLELNADLQAQIDSLKGVQEDEKRTAFSIDPTNISDYRGYLLGMSPKEIDRLHRVREKGKRIQSPAEFQKVTGISDSLLQVISPVLRFSVVKKS